MRRLPVGCISLTSIILASSAVGCNTLAENSTNPVHTDTIMSVVASTPKASNSQSIAALEQSIHQQINEYRKSRNLPPLRLDARISEQARRHSVDMAKISNLSHDGFDSRVKAIAQSIPYRGAAENVAYNQGYRDPAQQAVQGWINSSGHQKNMVGNYDLTGIGVATNSKGEYYFTQVFIRRR